MKKILEDTRVMAEDLKTEAKPKVALGYIALGLSYVAAAIAVIPVVIWFGAGQLGRKLIDDGQSR